LTLEDPGFDFSIQSEFRERLLAGGQEQQLLDALLERFRRRGLVKARGKQRTDSTHVQAAVRSLNRVECVGETLRQALNRLAGMAPHWLQAHVPSAWYERYGPRFEAARLPKTEREREHLALQIGQDGLQLLTWVYAPATPVELRQHPAIEILRQVWVQQYYRHDNVLSWRTTDNMPPTAHSIHSPYDPEARYSQKRQTEWCGYKVHLTETCDEERPRLITHVETTPATTQDEQMTDTIHTALAAKDLLPKEH
jgi:transposase